MLSFLKRPSQSKLDGILTDFQSDWHCHVLPGIDDGAKNEAETLAMLRCYVQAGIANVVATPHIHSFYFKNTARSIANAKKVADDIIRQNDLKIKLHFAAEYFADDYFMELIDQNDLLPIDNQYVLFELSMHNAPVFGRTMIEKIHKLGYTPILAHPERYRYWHNKPKEWAKWKDMGVCFQLNLLSLVGQYGSSERQAAEKMIDLDFIDAVGTDAHSPAHLEKLTNLANNSYFQRLQALPLLNRA